MDDIESASQFYRELMGMEGQRVSPGRHYFDLGGTILALYDPVADGDATSEWKYHPNQYLYISVSDVDSFFRRARDSEASLISDKVAEMPWEERLFYARDPFGTPICFVDSKTLIFGNRS